jgi:hypothetical protein
MPSWEDSRRELWSIAAFSLSTLLPRHDAYIQHTIPADMVSYFQLLSYNDIILTQVLEVFWARSV